MLKIGSHVSFRKEEQLLGTVKEALGFGENTFMFYTGAPQNTMRISIDDGLTEKAKKLMKDNNIDINDVVVHAPYIINLANSDPNKYAFSISFLKQECDRCYKMGITKLVLHPGSHVGLGRSKAIYNISNALNEVLKDSKTMILLETMAGKGSEVGTSIEDIREIFDNVLYKDKLGICLDTCHLWDGGYDLNDFDSFLDVLDSKGLFDKIKCIHINDSKNINGSHKDRHENIGFGYIGFDVLIKIIYNKRLEGIPKILETPYVCGKAPYKEEIEMIKSKKFDNDLKDKIVSIE